MRAHKPPGKALDRAGPVLTACGGQIGGAHRVAVHHINHAKSDAHGQINSVAHGDTHGF